MANKNKYSYKPLPGVRQIRGGINFVLFLDSVPGFVFKPMDDKRAAEKYIETIGRARQVVIDSNLFLLQVPQSKLVEIEGEFFVMQEKANLFWQQQGVYSYCWNDKDMRDYIKAVFSQLITFISRTGFADVKYDNIPFTTDGKVALIDLDEDSPVTGLTAGGAGKNDGLFNFIPYEYLDDFLETAKNVLKDETYQQLLQKIASIKTRAEKKMNINKNYSQFSQKNAISCPSQTINPDLPIICNDTKKQELAVSIVKCINQYLSESKNFSIKEGRTVFLDINVGDQLIKMAQGIWGPECPYSLIKQSISEVLEELKSAGYIYKYKMSAYYPFVRVVC